MESATEETAPPAPAGVENKGQVVTRRLVELMEEISEISQFRGEYKKHLSGLSRRIKLLVPMVEEVAERKGSVTPAALEDLERLCGALQEAKDLLLLGSRGSSIFLVLENAGEMKMFHDVGIHLVQALDVLSLEELDVSDEPREQVELVITQLKRMTGRTDTSDAELFADVSSVYNSGADDEVDQHIFQRLCEKLRLVTPADFKQESLALHAMAESGSGNVPEEVVTKMSGLLDKVKDFVETREADTGLNYLALSPRAQKSKAIPDDFRCPISLEMMKDPVIVSTGQTYERACIEQWLQAGHDTCPKTQQKLHNKSLTPNIVLRCLISQWCEAQGMDPPPPPCPPKALCSPCSASEHMTVISLLQKLSSQCLDDQRSAAGELRLLAKRSAENRSCIAEAGAIPILISLLTVLDAKIQEHAVTALLNLSIYDENKGRIVASGAIPGIVHVLKRGSMEAQENSAATLFSLSMVDEHKITIGTSGAILPLVSLLSNGSSRGKKDAASAIFSLSIYAGNRGRAVRAGAIPILMELLLDNRKGMVDEALAILAILSGHPEGRTAIGSHSAAVATFVKMIRSGSPRTKENAAAMLVHLCTGERQHEHLAEAQEHGLLSLLEELAKSGTERGKRKAMQLLERMNRLPEPQCPAAEGAAGLPSPDSGDDVLASSQD